MRWSSTRGQERPSKLSLGCDARRLTPRVGDLGEKVEGEVNREEEGREKEDESQLGIWYRIWFWVPASGTPSVERTERSG